jgi:hypothetical protein
MTKLNQNLHPRLFTLKNSFHPAILAVLHPALDALVLGLLLSVLPKKDALNFADDKDVCSCFCHAYFSLGAAFINVPTR